MRGRPDRGWRAYCTASLRPLPARNLGSFEAGIWIFSPVRGLRPSDAARLVTLKLPKPTRRTSMPFLSAPEIASNVASMIFATSPLARPVAAATASMSSFLFTRAPLWREASENCRVVGEELRTNSLDRASRARQRCGLLHCNAVHESNTPPSCDGGVSIAALHVSA